MQEAADVYVTWFSTARALLATLSLALALDAGAPHQATLCDLVEHRKEMSGKIVALSVTVRGGSDYGYAVKDGHCFRCPFELELPRHLTAADRELTDALQTIEQADRANGVLDRTRDVQMQVVAEFRWRKVDRYALHGPMPGLLTVRRVQSIRIVPPQIFDEAERQQDRCYARAFSGDEHELEIARGACGAAARLSITDGGEKEFYELWSAMVALRQNRDEDAWRMFDKLIQNDSDDAWRLYGRGVAGVRLGRSDGASDIARAIARDKFIGGSIIFHGIDVKGPRT